jgi:outer membrane protein OmpA-like peptidoglycan-associated protein
MFAHHRFSIITLIIFFNLSSCQTFNSFDQLNALESSIKTEPVYESYLALEYLNFSRKLLSVKDKKTSEYFAKKGLDSFARKDIIPENPLNWKADENQIKEMIFMQKRLEEISSIPSIRINLPIQLAHLTYLYDCWISKESSPIFASDEISFCKNTFSKLIEEMENYFIENKKDKTPKTKIIENQFQRFAINFDIENSNLNQKAIEDLDIALEYLLKIKGDFNIMLTGNGDNNDNSLLTQNLARDRINNVKSYLIANGVIENLIDIYYEQENLPDIVTNDSVEYKFNRTVAIYIFNGKKYSNSYPLPILQNQYLKEQIKKVKEKRGIKN